MQPTITTQDKKDLEKFIKFLCIKAAQVIVQGRLGKPISSKCSPVHTGAEWFNLAIKDYPEIQKEAKSALLEGVPNTDASFVIEISLRTSDCESMTLEVWSLSLTPKYEDVRVHHDVYNRMSLLLKSLMCVSRATPAYKLSRKQGSEYVICFRVYMGKVDVTGLGEGFKTLRVGSTGTPNGTLVLSAAFRTAENLHVSTKKLTPGTGDPIKVRPDHFYSPKNTRSPARPCHTLQSRLLSRGELDNRSQSPSGPVESPSFGVLPTSFCASPSELSTLESSRQRLSMDQDTMFTVGTPPTSASRSRFEVDQPSPSTNTSHRRFSDATVRAGYPSLISESHSCDSQQYAGGSSTRKLRHFPTDADLYKKSQYNRQRQRTVSERNADRSPQSPSLPDKGQLGGEDSGRVAYTAARDNVFKPITPSSVERTMESPTSHVLKNASQESPMSGDLRLGMKLSGKHGSIDSVTTLKSNSPASAKVGFPENQETTSHLTHVPPTRKPVATLSQSPPVQKNTQQMVLPSPGAFVSNSKTAARAYSTLTGMSDAHKLPFKDLMNEQKGSPKANKRNSSSDTSPESDRGGGSAIARLSSQGSLSSQHSSEQSPVHGTPPLVSPELDDEFVMVDLNPAFGKNDSAGDLGTFYRECENAPDLVMFQENNGTETREALLDLTKQLEDYEKDAEDFDNFVEELQSALT